MRGVGRSLADQGVETIDKGGDGAPVGPMGPTGPQGAVVSSGTVRSSVASITDVLEADEHKADYDIRHDREEEEDNVSTSDLYCMKQNRIRPSSLTSHSLVHS